MTAPLHSQNTDNGRFYFHPADNRSVPSITNIKGVKKFKAAESTAAKYCAQYASKNREKLATLDEDEVYRLVQGRPWAADNEKNISSRNGDIVHGWIDDHIKGAKVDTRFYTDYHTGEQRESNPTVRHMFAAFLDFATKSHHKPKWFRSEFTVWSDTHGYAGTMDIGMWIGGTLVLADTKTGKGAYPDMAMQLAAGANADFILEPDGSHTEMPKFERFGILHIRPRFWELIPVVNIEPRWRQFLALKTVFDVDLEYDDKTLLFTPKHQVRVSDAPVS